MCDITNGPMFYSPFKSTSRKLAAMSPMPLSASLLWLVRCATTLWLSSSPSVQLWLSSGAGSARLCGECSGASKPLDDWLLDSDMERHVMLMLRVLADSRAAWNIDTQL